MIKTIRKIVRAIPCLLDLHEWKHAGYGLPTSASPGPYYKCVRCGRDSRQLWEMEDDQRCRLERQVIRTIQRNYVNTAREFNGCKKVK